MPRGELTMFKKIAFVALSSINLLTAMSAQQIAEEQRRVFKRHPASEPIRIAKAYAARANRDPDEPFKAAIRDNNEEKVLELLQNGKADAKNFYDACGSPSKAQWPLLYAVSERKPDVVDLLIAQGAELNRADLAGWTCLHELAAKKQFTADDEKITLIFLNNQLTDRYLTTIAPKYPARTPCAIAKIYGHDRFIELFEAAEKDKPSFANIKLQPLQGTKANSDKQVESSWFDLATYFAGGMGITALCYVLYHKVWKPAPSK